MSQMLCWRLIAAEQMFRLPRGGVFVGQGAALSAVSPGLRVSKARGRWPLEGRGLEKDTNPQEKSTEIRLDSWRVWVWMGGGCG